LNVELVSWTSSTNTTMWPISLPSPVWKTVMWLLLESLGVYNCQHDSRKGLPAPQVRS
jgi:hypothetical protein